MTTPRNVRPAERTISALTDRSFSPTGPGVSHGLDTRGWRGGGEATEKPPLDVVPEKALGPRRRKSEALKPVVSATSTRSSTWPVAEKCSRKCTGLYVVRAIATSVPGKR